MKINVVIEVPDNWEQRLDMQPWIENEIKEDRWSWNYAEMADSPLATWKVTKSQSNKVFIASDDFTNDEALMLTGDYESLMDKIAFAQTLADKLNS